MSRIGKKPVKVSKGVKVNLQDSVITLEGAKGKLSLKIPVGIKVEQKDDELLVQRLSNSKQACSNHGTIRAHLTNMVQGVSEGHNKDLEIQGVGFRAQLKGKTLALSLGFSHPVEFAIPEGVNVTAPSLTEIKINGVDKNSVGLTAARIRRLKPPEPYKGKGIRYVGEVVRRKQGKAVTK